MEEGIIGGDWALVDPHPTLPQGHCGTGACWCCMWRRRSGCTPSGTRHRGTAAPWCCCHLSQRKALGGLNPVSPHLPLPMVAVDYYWFCHSAQSPNSKTKTDYRPVNSILLLLGNWVVAAKAQGLCTAKKIKLNSVHHQKFSL